MNKSGAWILFIITGIVIFVLLGLHMIVIHMDGIFGIFNPAGGSALDWDNVIYRSKSGFCTVTYIILLATALYHGFYGLRTIVFEMGPRKQVERVWTAFFWAVGIILFIVGTYAAIAARTIETAL